MATLIHFSFFLIFCVWISFFLINETIQSNRNYEEIPKKDVVIRTSYEVLCTIDIFPLLQERVVVVISSLFLIFSSCSLFVAFKVML